MRMILRAAWGLFRNPFSNIRKLRGYSLRQLYEQDPVDLVLALMVLAVSAVLAVYTAAFCYLHYVRAYARYPRPVANALRRALYYHTFGKNAALAVKYYRVALDEAEALGMDTFSDEVMGIKIRMAQWLETDGAYDAACQVLESLLRDCKKFVDVVDEHAAEGAIPWYLQPRAGLDPARDPMRKYTNAGVPETVWGKRTRVLQKAIAVSLKLGNLYADEHVLHKETAHEKLQWAVEAALREQQRRARDGARDGEGDFLTTEEWGASLESLAHSYEARSQFDMALPLFFRALTLCQDPCHMSVLMSNLAVAFAQHPPSKALGDVDVDAALPDLTDTPEQRRAAYLEAARRWAGNARDHAARVRHDQRTPECDDACATALCTLGDIASLVGDTTEARRLFAQAMATSVQGAVAHAEAGLKALADLESMVPASGASSGP